MFKFSALFAVFMSLVVLTGCVNTPTENVQTVDDRPFIMFTDAREGDLVILDGIQMGSAAQFSAGKAGLRIEAGTHFLEIQRSGKTVLSKKFYVAEGVSKTFAIGGY